MTRRLILAVVAGFVMWAFAPPAANADDCATAFSNGQHCYGIATFVPLDDTYSYLGMDGVASDVTADCAYIFDPSTHETDTTIEVWLVGKGGNWIEAGLSMSGGLGTPEVHQRFWVEGNASGTVYRGHVDDNPFVIGNPQHVAISWVPGSWGTWNVQIGGFRGTSVGVLHRPAVKAVGGMEFQSYDAAHHLAMSNSDFGGVLGGLQWTQADGPTFNEWRYPFSGHATTPSLSANWPPGAGWNTRYSALHVWTGFC